MFPGKEKDNFFHLWTGFVIVHRTRAFDEKMFIILLHTGYWILYRRADQPVHFLCTGCGHPNGSGSMHYMMPAVLPADQFLYDPSGLIGFYFFYLLLFDGYLSQKKIALLCITGLLGIRWLAYRFCQSEYIDAVISLQYNGSFGEILVMISLEPAGIGAWRHCVGDERIYTLVCRYKDRNGNCRKKFRSRAGACKKKNDIFFFNTINNIDVLIGKTRKGHLLISTNYRVSCALCCMKQRRHIPLSKELLYIERVYRTPTDQECQPKHFIRYSVEGDMVHGRLVILLLFHSLKMLFKHSGDTKADNGIVIKFVISPINSTFIAKIKLFRLYQLKSQVVFRNDLIQKRLSLLYPNKHGWLAKSRGFYKIHLTIFSHEN